MNFLGISGFATSAAVQRYLFGYYRCSNRPITSLAIVSIGMI